MASYKDGSVLKHNESAEFDRVYTPGTHAPHSGIYRCQACGLEVASNQGQPLPPQNVHPHPAPIKWKLVVYAVHKKAA